MNRIIAVAFWLSGALLTPCANAQFKPPLPPDGGPLKLARMNYQEAQKLRAEHAAKIYVWQDQYLQQMLNSNCRWLAIPAWLTPYADGNGNVWFSMPRHADDADPEASFRRSIEEIAAGGFSANRGGRILAIDKFRRVWATREIGVVCCYDGQKWKDYQLLPERDPRAQPATGPARRPRARAIGEVALADSSGNVHVITSSTYESPGIHVIKPDGQVRSIFFDVPKNGGKHWLNTAVAFFQQPGGRAVLHQLYDCGENCRVLYFDGVEWKEIDPRICKTHSINAAIPLANGAIGTICAEDHFWTYWPQGTPNAPTGKLDELCAKLDDPDPSVRESASEGLIVAGPSADPQIRKLLEKAASPEAEARLKDVLATFKTMTSGDHKGAALHAGRFVFDQCYLCSRGRKGETRLYVEDCQDRRTEKKYAAALITIDSKGTWDMRPVRYKQWGGSGTGWIPSHLFEDSRGGMWLKPCFRIEPEELKAQAAPNGIWFEKACFEDNQGRVYLSGRLGWVRYDPNAPPNQCDLPVTGYFGRGFYHEPGTGETWCSDVTHSPHRPVNLGKGGLVSELMPNWEPSGIESILPLANGAAVVLLQDFPDGPALKNHSMFWDGKEWHASQWSYQLVHKHAAELAKLAHRSLRSYVDYYPMLFLAGNGRDKLWYVDRRRPDGDMPGMGVGGWAAVDFFDGKVWHDLQLEQGEQLTLLLIDDADAMLCLKGDSLLRVSWDEGKWQRQVLGPRPKELVTDWSVFGPDGEVWVTAFDASDKAQLWRISGNQIDKIGVGAKPQFVDSKRRLWCTDRGRLKAFIDGQWAELSAEDVQREGKVVESTDGRIWYVHLNGLSHVEVDASGEMPVIREIKRYRLDSPKMDLTRVFCDEGNGIWIGSEGNSKSRYQLPPAE